MAEPRPARIAFVGAGVHATESLYPNFGLIPELQLVAVCDLDIGKAERAARKYGARWFKDLGQMLDTVRPDAVCACGPAEMHVQVGLEVLGRGIPVFLEKPPGLTAAAALSLLQQAHATGAWGMVGFMKRFAPANLVARDYIAGPEFGVLNSLSMIHGCGPYDDLRRMLVFNGIHLLDLARFLVGEVSEVTAQAAAPAPNVYAATITFRFANGALGQININSGHHWDDCFEQTYLSGSGAAVLVDASRAVEVMAPGRRFADPPDQRLYGWSGRYYVSGNMAGWWAGGHYTRGYWGELSHFARAVQGTVEPEATLEDGLRAMELIEAILESIATNRPVVLPS